MPTIITWRCHRELPESAVDELVITGTAAQILLARLMHYDMTIATLGPGGHDHWKYQEPDWWEKEDAEEGDSEEEDS
jgi:hypothetical protein